MNIKNIGPLNIFIIIVIVFLLGVSQFSRESTVYAGRQDKYSQLEIFSQVLSFIDSEYVEEVDDAGVVEGAIKGMLQELDPHSVYYTPEEYEAFRTDLKGEFGGLGMTVGMKDNAVIVVAPIEDTPAYRAGLKAGDIIYKINGELTAGMNTEDAVQLMRGEPKTNVNLTILRAGEDKPLEFTITRDIIKVKAVKSDLISNDIAYVRVSNFQDKSSNEVRDALKELDKRGAKAVILDLRYNPGGSLQEAVNMASLFLPPNQAVVSTKSRTKTEELKSINFSYSDTKRPLIVLVNEGSASASEIVAGAIQDYKRGIILGTTTFGKASVQSVYTLKGGAGMKLTTARYYTPLGRSIQGVGIIPDIDAPQGTITYSENSAFALRERDLSGHLVGENEGAVGDNKTSSIVDIKNDLQLQLAVQMIKGLGIYAK